MGLCPTAGVGLWLSGLWGMAATWQTGFSLAFKDLLFLLGAAMVFRTVASSTPQYFGGVSSLLLIAMTILRMLLPTPQPHVATSTDTPPEWDVQAELLVEIHGEENFERWKRWIGAAGCTTTPAFQPASADITELDDYFTVDIPDAKMKDRDVLLAKIQALDFVDWVEPNEVIRLDILPQRNAPRLRKSMGVNDPQVSEQWAMDALQMDKLYALLTTGKVKPTKRALVAILDTGVDAQHEDLKDNFQSIRKTYDTDPQGHGTHCAGIAGAVTNNGIGVASYARNNDFFRITSVTVLRAGGSGTQADIIKGILTAADNGADVLSMSLGGLVPKLANALTARRFSTLMIREPSL
ncbi:MAG: S8 family serine peptidase [Saprospiraceae bacterium]